MSLKHYYTTTLGSSQASITVSSIPQNGSDLLIKVSARGTGTGVYNNIEFQLNGTSTLDSGYILRMQDTTLSGTEYAFSSGSIMVGNGSTSGMFGVADFYVTNYTSSTLNKGISQIATADSPQTSNTYSIHKQLGRSNQTSPITSVYIAGTLPFTAGTTISVYTINN